MGPWCIQNQRNKTRRRPKERKKGKTCVGQDSAKHQWELSIQRCHLTNYFDIQISHLNPSLVHVSNATRGVDCMSREGNKALTYNSWRWGVGVVRLTFYQVYKPIHNHAWGKSIIIPNWETNLSSWWCRAIKNPFEQSRKNSSKWNREGQYQTPRLKPYPPSIPSLSHAFQERKCCRRECRFNSTQYMHGEFTTLLSGNLLGGALLQEQTELES